MSYQRWKLVKICGCSNEFDSPQTFKAFAVGVGAAGELAEFNGGPTNLV